METGDVLGRSVADASVRLARPGDAEAMGAVQARAWRHAYAEVLPAEVLDALTPPALSAAWRAAVTSAPSARHAVFVACSGSAVIGFVALSPAADPDLASVDPGWVGEITTLVVDPAHQRFGHGSRLLSAAADSLRGNGCTVVATWSPVTDEARRAFLQSAGMVPDGARRSYRGDDGREVTEVRLTAALAQG